MAVNLGDSKPASLLIKYRALREPMKPQVSWAAANCANVETRAAIGICLSREPYAGSGSAPGSRLALRAAARPVTILAWRAAFSFLASDRAALARA